MDKSFRKWSFCFSSFPLLLLFCCDEPGLPCLGWGQGSETAELLRPPSEYAGDNVKQTHGTMIAKSILWSRTHCPRHGPAFSRAGVQHNSPLILTHSYTLSLSPSSASLTSFETLGKLFKDSNTVSHLIK